MPLKAKDEHVEQVFWSELQKASELKYAALVASREEAAKIRKWQEFIALAEHHQKIRLHEKAADNLTKALELQPGDKWCLVARSKCYLKLGDPQTALKDAEQALKEDKDFNKGLYQKAEALYSMGDFEYALMYYHRGHKLRPELDEFRLGIQKAQEAIDNSIGSVAKVKLQNKGDLSFFKKQDDASKKTKGYSKPAVTTKQKPAVTRDKDTMTTTPSKHTTKQLLGELYADKEYLEKLMNDPGFISQSKNKPIHDLVQDGLNYLETRTEFWRQQKPLYARRREKHQHSSKSYSAKRRKQTTEKGKELLSTLEKIDNELANGKPDSSLKLALRTLKSLEGLDDKDIAGRKELVANCHSSIGNAYLDLEQPQKSLKHHQKDLDISTTSGSSDGRSRALDNVGRAYVKLGKFDKAIASWSEKLPLIRSPLESTWLYHEIGRCHMEMKNYQDAREFGEKSLVAAKEADDDVWQLNASVLVAQSDMKLNDLAQAVESFQSALLVADKINDKAALAAINKALDDISNRISTEEANDSDTEQTNDNLHENTESEGKQDVTEESSSLKDNEVRSAAPSKDNDDKGDSAKPATEVGSDNGSKNNSTENKSRSDSQSEHESVAESTQRRGSLEGGAPQSEHSGAETGQEGGEGSLEDAHSTAAEQNQNENKMAESNQEEEEEDAATPAAEFVEAQPSGGTVLSEDEDGFYS